MDYDEFKKEYESLTSKYNLPPFKDIDGAFELCFADFDKVKKNSVLVMTRRKMNEKIAWMVNVLQSIVMPTSASLINLHESKFFDEKHKEKVVELIRELMFFERQSLVLDLKTTQKEDAKFICDVMKDWNKIIKDTTEVSLVLRDGWKETEKKEFFAYLG